MATDPRITDAEYAIKELIADGVEFGATKAVICQWLERHGYLADRFQDGSNRAMRSNGNYLEGQAEWLTFHEMLADLLARIDTEIGGAK